MVITFRVFPDIQINTDLTRILWLKNISGMQNSNKNASQMHSPFWEQVE